MLDRRVVFIGYSTWNHHHLIVQCHLLKKKKKKKKMKLYLLIGLAIIDAIYVNADACVQCNSASEPKCATNPDIYLAKMCSNSTNTMCYVRILDGDTIRGCANDLDQKTIDHCIDNRDCLMCSSQEGCNRNPFPAHRASCLQCSSHFNGTCANDTYAKPEICPIYKLGDECYIRYDGKNESESFQRGCLSSAQKRGLCIDKKNCYTCEGAGCNFLPSNSNNIPMARDSVEKFQSCIILTFISILAAFHLF
uniref:DUF753 domain-containing protein n=1 Tax=Glossina brevipalpis TaxID=37001 RepID=A0A1A9WC43_9MUSC